MKRRKAKQGGKKMKSKKLEIKEISKELGLPESIKQIVSGAYKTPGLGIRMLKTIKEKAGREKLEEVVEILELYKKQPRAIQQIVEHLTSLAYHVAEQPELEKFWKEQIAIYKASEVIAFMKKYQGYTKVPEIFLYYIRESSGREEAVKTVRMLKYKGVEELLQVYKEGTPLPIVQERAGYKPEEITLEKLVRYIGSMASTALKIKKTEKYFYEGIHKMLEQARK